LRYGLDGTKIYDLGWRPKFNFEESLRKTVLWTLENEKWLLI
jgi:dTDP-D-glucose 4,6-dehydratase